MLEAGKEKAALRGAESLVVGFSCEVEAQPRDFAVALDEELAHTPGDEVFVNLDFDSLSWCSDAIKGASMVAELTGTLPSFLEKKQKE